MPDLVRLYIRHVAIGFALAAVFTGMLFWFNVANLGHLVTHAPGGALAAVLLLVFNGIVFAGVQFGVAVTAMARAPEDEADDDDDDDRGGHRYGSALQPQLVPIRINDQRPHPRRSWTRARIAPRV
jgi:hypothetical protein